MQLLRVSTAWKQSTHSRMASAWSASSCAVLQAVCALTHISVQGCRHRMFQLTFREAQPMFRLLTRDSYRTAASVLSLHLPRALSAAKPAQRASHRHTPECCRQVLDLLDPAQHIQHLHAGLLLARAGDDFDLALNLVSCTAQLRPRAPAHHIRCLRGTVRHNTTWHTRTVR